MSEVKHRITRITAFAVVAPILAILALSAWALASPVGASPDDDYHLASTWCATNEDTSLCHLATEEDERSVPNALLIAPCYAFDANESAACQGDSFDTYGDFVDSDRGNFSGAYPPVYYLTMNLFASTNIELSAVVMRIVNVVLFVALTTALYALLPAQRRPTLLWSWAISLVPLGMFLVASNNPSAWAIISAGTLWLALLGFFETTGARKIALGLLAVIATVMGAGSRADAAVYAVIAVGVVTLLTARWERRWILSALLPIVLVMVAIVFYLSTGQSTLVSSGLNSTPNDGVEQNSLGLILHIFLNVPGLWVGVFGNWGLGWLDTLMPAVVWVAGLGCFAALAFSGLASRSLRKLLAVLMVLAALWIIPTFILVQSQVAVGSEVQPRYILPLIVMLGGVALLNARGPRLILSKIQVLGVIAALSVANALALHYNLRRYVTGADQNGLNLDSNLEWWWNIPVGPGAIWILGSLAFAALLVLLAGSITRPSTRRGSTPKSRAGEENNNRNDSARAVSQ